MKIAILTANLGKFDTNTDPVKQDLPEGIDEIVFHRFTDDNFPPITGLTPRFQYRIPKMFGWEMFPGYDYYIWLDGSMSLQRKDSVKWFVEQMGDKDMAFFKHPWRNTVKEEVDHIEEYLKKGNKYITSRYKNGLHKEFYKSFIKKNTYIDTDLYASTSFIYRNNSRSVSMLALWWHYQARYYTCDQVQLPFALILTRTSVNKIDEDIFKCPFISLTSKHK